MSILRFLLLAAFSLSVHAQPYPSKPVKIVAIGQALAMPDVRERFQKVGITPAPSTPEELRKRYEHWMAIFGKIAKDVGLKPQ